MAASGVRQRQVPDSGAPNFFPPNSRGAPPMPPRSSYQQLSAGHLHHGTERKFIDTAMTALMAGSFAYGVACLGAAHGAAASALPLALGAALYLTTPNGGVGAPLTAGDDGGARVIQLATIAVALHIWSRWLASAGRLYEQGDAEADVVSRALTATGIACCVVLIVPRWPGLGPPPQPARKLQDRTVASAAGLLAVTGAAVGSVGYSLVDHPRQLLTLGSLFENVPPHIHPDSLGDAAVVTFAPNAQVKTERATRLTVGGTLYCVAPVDQREVLSANALPSMYVVGTDCCETTFACALSPPADGAAQGGLRWTGEGSFASAEHFRTAVAVNLRTEFAAAEAELEARAARAVLLDWTADPEAARAAAVSAVNGAAITAYVALLAGLASVAVRVKFSHKFARARTS